MGYQIPTEAYTGKKLCNADRDQFYEVWLYDPHNNQSFFSQAYPKLGYAERRASVLRRKYQSRGYQIIVALTTTPCKKQSCSGKPYEDVQTP
jgi:hypothetical protein